jgi:hypothetical protein
VQPVKAAAVCTTLAGPQTGGEVATMTQSARAPSWVRAAAALAALLLAPRLAAAAAPADEQRTNDPLAAEIARWSTYLSETTSPDEHWKDVKESMTPAMARVEAALKDGKRLLALERLAATRINLASFAYVNALPADARDDAAKLDAEWKRVGGLLGAKPSLDGLLPAAVRAEGEAAVPQIKNYYDAALEYGQATGPWFGFYYLGAAQAQGDFVSFCRTLSAPAGLKAPPVRSIAGELDALEADLLKAYRPPASIDRHGEFITASAALKEARELDAAGLRYGALLRYLQAAMRVDALRPDAPAPDLDSLPKRLEALETRLRKGGVDHSIARVYLETAQAHMAAAPGANPVFAEAIVSDVIPRYFAALTPAKPVRPKPAASVTVTLVRWPYT